MPEIITTHHAGCQQGPNDQITLCRGAAGAGGAADEYVAYHATDPVPGHPMFQVAFQTLQRPVGCTNELLLAIVLDRLEGFQQGPFPSVFNEGAIRHLKLALGELSHRTQARVKAGVEGKAMSDDATEKPAEKPTREAVKRIWIDGDDLHIFGSTTAPFSVKLLQTHWSAWDNLWRAIKAQFGAGTMLSLDEWDVLQSLATTQASRSGLMELRQAVSRSH